MEAPENKDEDIMGSRCLQEGGGCGACRLKGEDEHREGRQGPRSWVGTELRPTGWVRDQAVSPLL